MDEIRSADPSVEHLRHVGSHSLQPGCGQFFCSTCMVDLAKFINHKIFDGLEGTHHVLAGFALFLDVGLKVASIVVKEKAWFDLW